LQIFDAQGRLIRTMESENMHFGQRSITFEGSDRPAGIYLMKLTTQDKASIRKVVIIR